MQLCHNDELRLIYVRANEFKQMSAFTFCNLLEDSNLAVGFFCYLCIMESLVLVNKLDCVIFESVLVFGMEYLSV